MCFAQRQLFEHFVSDRRIGDVDDECHGWYDSREYQKILPGRLDNSTSRAFVVEGVS